MDKSRFEAKIEDLLEGVPESLPVWEALTQWGTQRAIAQVNYEVATADKDKQSDFVAALDWMVYWIMRYVPDPDGTIAFGDEANEWPDMDEAWTVAKKHGQVKNLLQGVKSELLKYEYDHGRIRLPYNGHPELALLGRSLAIREATEGFGFKPNMPDLGRWLVKTEGQENWFGTPHPVRKQVRESARSLAATAPPYLPTETPTPIDGATLGNLGKYWNELMAISLYHFFAMQHTGEPDRTVYVREEFVRHMSSIAGIPEKAVGKITDSLTTTKSYAADPKSPAVHNPQLTPIVEVDSGLFLVSSLIVSSMPSHHNMKLLQVVHRRGFKAKMANPLGITGENVVADHLEQVLRGDPHVATRIKAVGGYGPKDPPDLDVVVYSPGKLLLVMEVKWHIAVSNTFEAVRKEDEARRGRCRLDKLRHKIACGKTTVKWPELWDEDDANSCEWRWFVLTHDTIPVHNLGDSDIKIRSYLLLKHLLNPDPRLAT